MPENSFPAFCQRTQQLNAQLSFMTCICLPSVRAKQIIREFLNQGDVFSRQERKKNFWFVFSRKFLFRQKEEKM
jgi:hypothetical protein